MIIVKSESGGVVRVSSVKNKPKAKQFIRAGWILGIWKHNPKNGPAYEIFYIFITFDYHFSNVPKLIKDICSKPTLIKFFLNHWLKAINFC